MIEPEAIPDRDYTTQQTADLCGISINTLLSWERRYGVPRPHRNARGERTYTPEDIAQIRWLRAETGRGTPIREAVRMLNQGAPPSTEPGRDVDDVIVALDAAPDPGLATTPAPASGRENAARRDLLAALERLDRTEVASLLSRLALESDPAVVAGRVVLPVTATLIQKAQSEEISPATTIVALRWLRTRLGHWLDVANPQRHGAAGVVLLAPEGGDAAELAALARALRSARQNHHVIDLPSGLPLESLVDLARSTGATRIELVTDGDPSSPSASLRVQLLRDLLPGRVGVTLISSGDSSRIAEPPIASFPPASRDVVSGSPGSPAP